MPCTILELVLCTTSTYKSPLLSFDILSLAHLTLGRISFLEFSTTNSTVVPSPRLEEDEGIPAGGLVQCSLFVTKRRELYVFHKSPWTKSLHMEFEYPLSKKEYVHSWHGREGGFLWPLPEFPLLSRSYSPGQPWGHPTSTSWLHLHIAKTAVVKNAFNHSDYFPLKQCQTSV